MKIAIVTPSPVPFNIGGAEKLFIGMLYNFNKISSHQFELIKIPVKDQDFWELMKGYYDFYNLDLSYFDAVITTKYPAWMINHKNHILYMQHTCRGVYDLYPKNMPVEYKITNRKLLKLDYLLKNDCSIKDLLDELMELREIKDQFQDFNFPGPLTRAIIHKLDRLAVNNISSYNAISKNVANRKGYFPQNKRVSIIYHPSTLEGLYCENYKYIFTASRLEKLKRIDMLIKAFMKTEVDIEFLIAGTGGEESYLKRLAKGDKRIKFLGFISDEELKKHYANALFIPYVPYDEDYGLITIEAMKSEKAVLTVKDSGGVKEFVKHGVNGYIAEPNEKSLFQYMDKMFTEYDKTIQMGKNAKTSVERINWKNLLIKLLEPKKLKKIVLLKTFSIKNPVNGGALRIFNLYKHLTDDFQILHITLGDEYKKEEIYQNFYEITIPKTDEFIKKETALNEKFNTSLTDIAFMLNFDLVPDYARVIKKEYLKGVDLFILEHPYAYTVFKKIFSSFLPIHIYSSHNVEYELKSSVFNDDDVLNKLKYIERELVLTSKRIITCTEKDKNEYAKFCSGDKIKIISNGIELSETDFTINNNSNIVIFIGSYHKPNIEAVQFILETAKELKNYEFLILGSVCNAFSEEIENVKFLGIVSQEEKKRFYKMAKYAVNPVFSGSGSNLKLIEYLSFGKYVLTTSVGIRGFEEFRENVLLFENKEEFIRRITTDIPNIENVIYKIRKYDWKNLSKILQYELKNVLKKHKFDFY